MRRNSSRRKSSEDNEVAASLVRKCVALLGKSGFGTDRSFRVLARETSSSHYRMRVLYYDQVDIPTKADEDVSVLRRSVERFLSDLERKHLELAEQCRREKELCGADTIKSWQQ